jgi:hypothetical protein
LILLSRHVINGRSIRNAYPASPASLEHVATFLQSSNSTDVMTQKDTLACGYFSRLGASRLADVIPLSDMTESVGHDDNLYVVHSFVCLRNIIGF